jgi:hypothetical protein
MRRRILFIGVVCFITLITHNISFGQFKLQLNVPLYGQKYFYYCGPACAQMMMMGYPPPAIPKLYDQEVDIYPKILQNRTDTAFTTDPDGLCRTVMGLNPPPAPGQYSIFYNTDQGIVMHDILFWMATREYPTAALVLEGNHWVVITGFETDNDPRSGDVTLKYIYINDPCLCPPQPNGVSRIAEGSWLANDFTKNMVGPNGSKWLYQYVAIVEPPKISGRVTTKEEISVGKAISPEKAIELALQHVKDRKLSEEKRFEFLKKTYPREASLVNEKYKGYYIVPFEVEKGKSSLGAVLLNAYTGEFQEIGAFSAPLEYLSKEAAIRIAIRSIKQKPIKPPTAELVFKPSEQALSRYCPLWKVLIPVEGITIIRYVNQSGMVYPELTSLRLGGN